MNLRADRWMLLSALAFGVGCSASGVITKSSSGHPSSGGASSGGTGPGGSGGVASSASGGGGTTGKATGGSTGKNGGSSNGGHSSSNGGVGSTSSGGNGATSGGNGTIGGNASSGGASSGAASSNGGGTGAVCVSSGVAPSTGGTYYGVLERNNDAMRDGVYVDSALQKTALPNLQVDPIFSSPATGWNDPVFSQPLYFVNSTIGHDLVIVTTDSNEIWALDSVTGTPVWPPITQLLSTVDKSQMASCGGSVNPIGITGTPVIDPTTRTMYLNASTIVAGTPHYQIFGIDLDNGSTVANFPIDVEGVTVNYEGGTRPFVTSVQNQRGALLLLNGILYVPYGGLDGDCGEYRGVVLSVPVANPTAVSGWETAAPSGGGIWGPAGVASDGTSLFVATGNTNSDPSLPTLWPDANSEAIIRLTAGNPPTFSGNSTDYFAPSDPTASGCSSSACGWYLDDEDDRDLGSSGVVLFNIPGATPSDLAFASGKTMNAYLTERSNLGGISTGLSEVPSSSSQVFGSMAAYTSQGITYVVSTPSGGGMITFTVSQTSPPILARGWTTNSGGTGSPIVSTSDGTNDYVVWATDGNLTALDGDTGKSIVSLSLGNYTHWVTPIIAKGAIYVAGNNQVYKFSLPAPCP